MMLNPSARLSHASDGEATSTSGPVETALDEPLGRDADDLRGVVAGVDAAHEETATLNRRRL